MTTRKTLQAALLGACAIAALTAAAQAETLRYAIGWPPGTVAADAVETFASVAEERSNGDLEVEVYPLSLLNFLEASSGARDGIADIVTILTPYFLSEFPETNFVTELAGMMELYDAGDKGPMAFSGALTEYVMLHCDDCQAEFAEQNQLFTAGASSPSYILQCMTPIASLEDLKGKRVRAGGAFWSRWIEHFGGTPVSMSINETFEGLSQGVLDCTASNATELSNFGFIDVVEDITTGAPGAVYASATSSINRDTWASLSEADRTALLHASAAVTSHMTWNYWAEGEAQLVKAREKGIAFHELSDADNEKIQSYIRADVETLIQNYESQHGVQNGADKVQTMRDLIEKWIPLVQDAQDPEALTQVYWDEIMSKVDPASYGL